MKWFAALMLVAAISSFNQSPPSPQVPPARTGLITGKVVDGDTGTPVGGAVVSLSPLGSANPVSGGRALLPATLVLTGSDGRFFFSALAGGSFALTASKTGWLSGALGRRQPNGGTTLLELADGERRGNLSIPVWKYAVISGRVTDDRGDPVVGANVRAAVVSYVAGRPTPTLVARARTDDRGVYRLTNLTPGTYFIAVPAAVMSEPATFDNAVRASNALLPNAYLQTMTDVGAAPYLTLERAKMPANGGRTLVSMPPGVSGPPPTEGPWVTTATTFAPEAASIARATAVHAEAGREAVDTNIVLRFVPTFRVSGMVTDPTGPVAHHVVHLISADAGDFPMFDVASGVTDENGAFTMLGVPPGAYLANIVRVPWPADGLAPSGATGELLAVSAHSTPPNFSSDVPLMSVSVPVTVADRDVVNLGLVMRPGGRFSGHVEFDGTSTRPTPAQLQAAWTLLDRASGRVPNLSGRLTLAADGTFDSGSVWPGHYFVRGPAMTGWTFKSAIYQGRDVSETPLDVGNDASITDIVITYTDHPAKITGNVQVPPSDLSPVVIIFPTDQRAWIDYGRGSRSVRNVGVSAGTFTLIAPPSGAYFVVALLDNPEDWQDPALLQKLSRIADRIDVRDGQSLTLALVAKAVPR